MLPNMDPRALKGMMDKLGIKSSEIPAEKVVIDCGDREILIENPSVVLIEGKGMQSFQISGNVTEVKKSGVSEDDVKLVQQQTGTNAEEARSALEMSNGNIAEAILKLKNRSG